MQTNDNANNSPPPSKTNSSHIDNHSNSSSSSNLRSFYINTHSNPSLKQPSKFCSNKIKTAKYNA